MHATTCHGDGNLSALHYFVQKAVISIWLVQEADRLPLILCVDVRRWASHLVLNAVNDGEPRTSLTASRQLARRVILALLVLLAPDSCSVTEGSGMGAQAISSSCMSRAATTRRCSRAIGPTTTSRPATATSAHLAPAAPLPCHVVPDAWHSSAQITEAHCLLIATTSRYVSLLCVLLLILKQHARLMLLQTA